MCVDCIGYSLDVVCNLTLSPPPSILHQFPPSLPSPQDLLMVFYLSNLTQMQMSLGEKLSFLTI